MKSFNFKQKKRKFEEICKNLTDPDKIKGALFALFEKSHSNGIEFRNAIEEGKYMLFCLLLFKYN